MAVDVGTAVGYLDLDTSKFQSGFKSALTDLKTFGDNTQSMQTRLGALGSTFTSAGSTLTKGLTLPLLAVGTAAVKIGNDFQAQMSRVQAISGATGSDLEKLRQQAIDLGASTAFSALEAAEGMENLASAGFNATEIMGAMPGVLDLAAVSGGDVALASENAASALRAFGLDASQAGHIADVFARAAADTNAEVGDMGEAMKYIAPVAAGMGISLEETAAAVGILSDAGIKGSQAGTTLRTSLLRLASPTEKMEGVMKRLGLTFFDSSGNMLTLEKQVEMLQSSFAGLTQEQQMNALATLYGKEAVSGMLVLIQSGPEKLASLTKSLENSGGAADEMAKIMQDNAASAIEEMFGAMESAAIVIQSVLEPVIRSIADTINDWVSSFVQLDEKTQRQIVTIAAIVAAIGPLMLIIGKVISVIAGLIPLITTLKTAFVTLNLIMALNPALAVAAGIAVLVAGIAVLIGWLSRETEEQKKLSAQTEKVIDANDKLIDSMEDSENAFDSKLSSIEAESIATQNLANYVFDLAEKENKSAEDKAKLTAATQMLNEMTGETIVAYDAEADAISKTREEVNSLLEVRKQELQTQAQQERAIEIAKEQAQVEEQLNAITRQRIELELAKADGVYEGWLGEKRYKDQQEELIASEQELTAAKQELTEAFDYQTEQMVAGMAEQEAASQAAAETFVAMNGDIMASQDEVIKKNEDLVKAMEEYTAAVTDMFKKITEEAAGTVEEYLATLDHNYEASQRFVDNLQILMDKGMDEAIVQQFRDKGIAAAGEVALWANATDPEIQALNEKISRNLEQGSADAATVMRVGGQDIVAGLVEGIGGEMSTAEDSGKDLANAVIDSSKDTLGVHSPSTVYKEIGQNIGEGLEQGITGSMPGVVNSITKAFTEMITQAAKIPVEIRKHLDTTLKNAVTWSTEMYAKTSPNIKKMVDDAILNANRLHPEFKKVFDTILQYTAAWYTQMIQKGVEFDTNFNKVLILNIGKLPPEFKTVYDSIYQYTSAWYTQMIQKATDLATNFNDTIITKTKKLPEELKKIFNEILTYLNSLKSEFSSAGTAMMTALYDAMKKSGVDITQWVKDWAADIEKRIKAVMNALEDAKDAADKLDSMSSSSGSHAAGLAYVPHDGYNAILHEGERVLTAEENRAYNRGDTETSGGGRTYNFFSPVPITPVEARKQMVQAEIELALGFK